MTGTDSRIGVWVRDTCAHCADTDVLVYEAENPGGEVDLLCASCYRAWAVEHPKAQTCDNCGDDGNVWRDPLHRRNEYLCIKCHDPESLFQNRWANKVRQSLPLGMRERPQCGLRGYGTECRGEVKWRSAMNDHVCNKHAGKQGVGPNG